MHHVIKLLFSFYTVILSIWRLSSMLPPGQKMTDRAPDTTSMYQAEEKEERWKDKGYAFQLIPLSSFISDAVDIVSVYHLKLSLVPWEVHIAHFGHKYMGAQLSLLNLSSLKHFSSP